MYMYVRNLKKADLAYFSVKRITVFCCRIILLLPPFSDNWASQARLLHLEKKEKEREKRVSNTDLENCVDGGKLEPNKTT